MLLAAAIAILAAPGAGAAPSGDAVLRRHAPVYRLDRAERSPPTSVRAAAALAPGLAARVAGEPAGPAVYARAVRAGRTTRLQYWTFHRDNAQDRGVLRTGRHAGDWELVQVRLDGGRPTSAVYLRHSWAERCPWARVEREGARPVVHVANASHAAYFTRGVHGRPWPDPDDEARDGGAVLRPPVRRVAAERPPWMAYRGRWGGARAGLVPGEQSSPRGPARQPESWDAARVEARARPCGAGAPGRPAQVAAEIVAALAVVAAVGVTAMRRRRPRR